MKDFWLKSLNLLTVGPLTKTRRPEPRAAPSAAYTQKAPGAPNQAYHA